ncbi:MAG TPA: AMP-binding protein [Caldimonas sp.]|jgi:acyl-coenzyme A synthetase/AMP-(fatty) acid ligase|nr:AMP-binding protein [Caldimonas sp.]HEX2539741.1 AMP-binding protein [Caldimonas sp.]
MSDAPLLAGELDLPIAWRDGEPITRRQYIADASALAERLPAPGAMLNLSSDRYRFAVGLAAALLRGHASLLPPNHLADTVARLKARFAGAYALVETGGDGHGLPSVAHASAAADTDGVGAIPSIAADLVAAHVLTSGSTGDPVPHAKPWGLLVRNARAEARRLAEGIGRTSLDGMALVATVPPQHMYGFESSVLIALHGGAAFAAGRPFYPADVAAALAAVPAPRILVTTPFHLKAVLDAGIGQPPLALVVCATAPLAPQLAARAEQSLRAPLVEIYGCTEAGQVATRRTTSGPEWRTFDGLRLSGDGSEASVSGGHVPQATVLADVLEVLDPETFRLLGRSNDLVNVAGKRSSIGHLNFHLNSIDGVVDGAFWMPPARDDADDAAVTRLIAFVVAPGLSRRQIHAALRERVDAAFLPRRIVQVEALPREPTGKLTAASLAALAAAASTADAP